MKFVLPYDKKRIPVEIEDRNFVGSLVSKVESYKPGLSQQELVEASLDHPIGSPKLEELAKGKKNIVIISSDHTRQALKDIPENRSSFVKSHAIENVVENQGRGDRFPNHRKGGRSLWPDYAIQRDAGNGGLDWREVRGDSLERSFTASVSGNG